MFQKEWLAVAPSLALFPHQEEIETQQELNAQNYPNCEIKKPTAHVRQTETGYNVHLKGGPWKIVVPKCKCQQAEEIQQQQYLTQTQRRHSVSTTTCKPNVNIRILDVPRGQCVESGDLKEFSNRKSTAGSITNAQEISGSFSHHVNAGFGGSVSHRVAASREFYGHNPSGNLPSLPHIPEVPASEPSVPSLQPVVEESKVIVSPRTPDHQTSEVGVPEDRGSSVSLESKAFLPKDGATRFSRKAASRTMKSRGFESSKLSQEQSTRGDASERHMSEQDILSVESHLAQNEGPPVVPEEPQQTENDEPCSCANCKAFREANALEAQQPEATQEPPTFCPPGQQLQNVCPPGQVQMPNVCPPGYVPMPNVQPSYQMVGCPPTQQPTCPPGYVLQQL